MRPLHRYVWTQALLYSGLVKPPQRLLPKVAVLLAFACSVAFASCSTAPSTDRVEGYTERARETTAWFERNVRGLPGQIDGAAGFIVFPDVARWGILLAGGQFGRGAVCRSDGTQIGWAAINNASIGLQAGVIGFRMIIVLQNQEVLDRFTAGTLTGSAAGVLVLAESGATASVPFANGTAVYQGAQRGLMGGVNIGFDLIRFVPLESGEVASTIR